MEQVNTTKTAAKKKRKGQRLGWSVQLDIAAMRKLIELFKLAHVQWDYFLGVRTRVNKRGVALNLVRGRTRHPTNY